MIERAATPEILIEPVQVLHRLASVKGCTIHESPMGTKNIPENYQSIFSIVLLYK
jgi:hypothetical protein